MSLELTQASALRPVVTTLLRRGIDVGAYLQAADIPPELLRLTYAPLAKRNQIWTFLEAVERGEGLETLGFLLGDRMDLRETGPFGINISNAATLYDALQMVKRLMPDFSQGNRISLTRHGPTSWMSIKTPTPKSRPADHYALKFLVAVARLAAGPRWVPEHATLQTEEVLAIFELPYVKNCEIRFDAPCASIEIPATLLSQPLRSTGKLFSSGISRLRTLPDPRRLSDSLRAIVAAVLPYRGPPSALKAAELIGISRGTLFNRLAKEATTYTEIVGRVRYQAAQELLRHSKLSVKEIAHRLGYAAPNNFVRAFRKIAGVTPRNFRRERLVDESARR